MVAVGAAQRVRQRDGAPAQTDRGVAARTRERSGAQPPRARRETVLVLARDSGARLRAQWLATVDGAMERHPRSVGRLRRYADGRGGAQRRGLTLSAAGGSR